MIARLDFDALRIGPLAGASDALRAVKGTAEVVAFPSPFDRSIRVLGDGSHQFCVSTERLEGGAVSIEMDLFASAPLSSGRLRLLMAPIAASATAVNVPLEMVGRMQLDAWHHLAAIWTPGQPVAIAIEDAARGQPQTLTVPSVAAGRAAPGSVCVAVSGMAKNAEVLIDNLRVKQ